MAKTTKPSSDRVVSEVAAFIVDRLVDRYKAMADERKQLHEMAMGGAASYADEALHLIEVPFDDLAGIASQLDGPIKDERRAEFVELVNHSPLAGKDALVAWLHHVAGCSQVAWFIEGADVLRGVLARALDVSPPKFPHKQSA